MQTILVCRNGGNIMRGISRTMHWINFFEFPKALPVLFCVPLGPGVISLFFGKKKPPNY